MSETQQSIRVGAQAVISADGLAVVVITGDSEWLMGADDAMKFGTRIIEEAQRVKGMQMTLAGMADLGLSQQTMYRAMHFAAYGKRVNLTRKG